MSPLRAASVLAAGLCLAACSVTTTTAEPQAAPIVACGESALTVTMAADDVVRAVNNTGQPCELGGKYPIIVPWWQTQDPAPSPATGALTPGSSLVQAYRAVASNGCPLALSPGPSATTMTITVEDHPYNVTVDAQQAHEIQSCDQTSALPLRIEPPPDPANKGTLIGHLYGVGGPPPGTRQAWPGTITATGDGLTEQAPVGPDGAYSLTLGAGQYTVAGQSPNLTSNGIPAKCYGDHAAQVTAGATAELDVLCHMK